MRRGSPSLAVAIYAFVLIGTGLGASFVTAGLLRGAASVVDRVTTTAVETRARGLSQALSRSLAADWNSLNAVAAQIGAAEGRDAGAVLDTVAAAIDGVSWLGFAAPDGTVMDAAGDLLKGQSVAARPWFQRGLEGPFAGDVHEALLLAKLLKPEGDEPPRFIDYAVPVKAPDGRVIGVLGMHLDFNWAASLISEAARSLDMEVILTSADGSPIVSTLAQNPARPELGSFRLASLGFAGAVKERWPDGQSYFSVIGPVQIEGVPSFGWRLIARIDEAQFATIDGGFVRGLLPLIAGLACVLAIATVIFVRLFAAPFQAVAASAEALANGADDYPFESARTSELSTLSAALARLQSRLRGGKTG